MPLSRVWVGRISKTRGVLETSECPKAIQSFRFPKFIIHFVTIFDESSVVKFLNLEKKNKQTQFSQLFYFLMHFSFLPWWCTLKMEALVRFCKKMLAGFPTWEIQLLLKSGKKFRILWTSEVLTFEANSTVP